MFKLYDSESLHSNTGFLPVIIITPPLPHGFRAGSYPFLLDQQKKRKEVQSYHKKGQLVFLDNIYYSHFVNSEKVR